MIRKLGTNEIDTISIREPLEPVESVTVVDIKQAVLDLATTAMQSVQVVRDSFVAGIAPLQVVSSGSVSSYLSGIVKSTEGRIDATQDQFAPISTRIPLGAILVKSTSHLGLATSTAGSSVPPPRPELDSADVFESVAGVLDPFSVKLLISLPISDISRVRSVKVMRAKTGAVKAPRPGFFALTNAGSMPSSGKGFDPVAAAAFRAADSGVGNKLTSFVVDDSMSSQRSVSSPEAQSLREIVPTQNTNKGASSSGLLTLAGADRSIVENLTFYANRRTIGSLEAPENVALDVVNRSGLNVLMGNSVAAAVAGIVQESNSMSFSEIGRVDMAGTLTRSVGEFVEASFVDKAVVYGASFVYYVSCIGLDGAEGPRSRLVSVPIVKTVPPPKPDVVFSIIGGHPRFVVRCDSKTDHVEVFRSGRSVLDSVKLGSDQSLIMQGPATKVGQFWHVKDLGLGADRSTTFVDDGAISGDKLSYRFYSVDSYGLKSQTPFSCSIKMPAHGHNIPIAVPSLTVEQAAGQPGMSVKMQIDDERVAGFVVHRREVSIHERAVHQASQPEMIDIGVFTPKRAGSRRGPALKDADLPLYLPASGGAASFVDSTVRLDRRYQYAVQAIDIRGNRTLMVGSHPVGIYSRPIVDAPTAFAAAVTVSGDDPSGVLLTWSPGTNDFSPNSIVDDQDVLAATSVRSVFQVERRKVGAPFWDAMPATSESWFFDKASDEPAPAFRPEYVIPGSSYEYRVIAMQSGGFVTPRTDTLPVTVIPPPRVPSTIWVRSTPINVNPMSIIVSWEMGSKFVDRWEIERAVTNKIYGGQIGSMDSKVARSLEYMKVADITPEASRARGIVAEGFELDKSVYIGNRFYVDSDVNQANSYFYRVRSVNSLGVPSAWTYGGVNISNFAFDRKLFSTLTDDVKVMLTANASPIHTDSQAILTANTAVEATPTVYRAISRFGGRET